MNKTLLKLMVFNFQFCYYLEIKINQFFSLLIKCKILVMHTIRKYVMIRARKLLT